MSPNHGATDTFQFLSASSKKATNIGEGWSEIKKVLLYFDISNRVLLRREEEEKSR